MAAPKIDISYKVTENGRKAPNWTLDSDIEGKQSLEDILRFTKNALITISDQVLKEEQAKGFDKYPTLIVDRKFNKRLYEVNPLGIVQYVSRQAGSKILTDTYKAILERSPYGKGRYISSNVVTYNGLQIAKSLPELEKWLENRTFNAKDKIRFVNTVPYARKLERLAVTKGKARIKVDTDKRRAKKRAPGKIIFLPNGTYKLTELAIKRKYKNNSFIKFEFVPGEELGLTGAGRVYKTGKTIGKPYLYPTILIYIVEAGITDSERGSTL